MSTAAPSYPADQPATLTDHPKMDARANAAATVSEVDAIVTDAFRVLDDLDELSRRRDAYSIATAALGVLEGAWTKLSLLSADLEPAAGGKPEMVDAAPVALVDAVQLTEWCAEYLCGMVKLYLTILLTYPAEKRPEAGRLAYFSGRTLKYEWEEQKRSRFAGEVVAL
jgi:hypothetical protein